jgi:hypothetical protein
LVRRWQPTVPLDDRRIDRHSPISRQIPLDRGADEFGTRPARPRGPLVQQGKELVVELN